MSLIIVIPPFFFARPLSLATLPKEQPRWHTAADKHLSLPVPGHVKPCFRQGRDKLGPCRTLRLGQGRYVQQHITCSVSTTFDRCLPILWIRHLATELHQVNTFSPDPSLNTLLHIVTTVPGIDVEGGPTNEELVEQASAPCGAFTARPRQNVIPTISRYETHHPCRRCNFAHHA